MPFLIPLIALVTGILIGEDLNLPVWGLIPVVLALGYYLFLLKKSATPLRAFRYKKRHAVWIFLLFCGIGIFDVSLNASDAPPEKDSGIFILGEGEVIDSKSRTNGDKLIVRINRLVDSTGNVHKFRNFKITVTTHGLSADIGDLITFPARLKIIKDNPNYRPTGYAGRMKREGILYNIQANENDIKIKGFNNNLYNSSVAWRNRLISKIEYSSLSRSAVNFIVALVFGDRSFLPEDVRTSFSNAGVAHVLALSGMHVAIIMGILLFLLFPLKLIGCHRLRNWLAILIIWGYAFFTGLAPSTVRACIMTTLVVAAWSIERKNSSENALLGAAFIILLVSPQALFDIGMQLSFLCVGSILLFAGPLNPVSRHFHPRLHSLVGATLVSLVATLTTWVIVSFYFKNIPLLFLPVNLCLLPLLPVYMWVAILYIIFLSFGKDPVFLSWLLDNGYQLFEKMVSFFSGYGDAVITYQAQLPIVIFWLLGILIISLGIRRKKDKRKTLIIGGMSMMIFAILLIPFLKEEKPDSIIFQKGFNSISVALYDGDNLNVSELPRNSVSRLFHKGSEIISIDCAANMDSLAAKMVKRKNTRGRYMILGSGFRGTKLSELPGIRDYDKIILHSSIKRKMEAELKRQALEMGLKSIYSLREEGPLEELLPDTLLATR